MCLLSFTVFIVGLQFAIFKKGVEEEEVVKKINVITSGKCKTDVDISAQHNANGNVRFGMQLTVGI